MSIYTSTPPPPISSPIPPLSRWHILGISANHLRELVIRTCAFCKLSLPINRFRSRGGSRSQDLRSYCRSCEPKYRRVRLLATGKARETYKRWRRALRMKCLLVYGGNPPSCACCGESENHFLAIDHINGGGNNHRKTEGYQDIFPWLSVNKFPLGFQVLCHNCNMAKGFYGRCPHEHQRIRLKAVSN